MSAKLRAALVQAAHLIADAIEDGDGLSRARYGTGSVEPAR
jgi:hypothetical protein